MNTEKKKSQPSLVNLSLPGKVSKPYQLGLLSSTAYQFKMLNGYQANLVRNS